MADNNDDYSAVPPPPSLSAEGGEAPINFNDALSKARAIAEKLKQQKPPEDSSAPPPSMSAHSAGSKRYYDDQEDFYYDSQGRYGDDRESKRGNYGDSRSGYGGNSRPRYGLGSEERHASSSYGAATSGEPVVQEEFLVPNHMVGLVIGKGGENLKKIENMSGTRLQFAPDMGEQERRLDMSGEADQVKIARNMVQQVIDDARSNESARYSGPRTTDYAAMASSRAGSGSQMTIPSSKVGLLIGRGGETIRDLEDRSGAKITIAPEGPGERGHERTVSLIGNDGSVDRARRMIEDLLGDQGYTGSVTPSRDWGAYRQQRDSREGDRSNDRFDSYGPPSDRVFGGSGGGGGGGGYRGGGGDRYGNNERASVQVPKTAVGFIIGKGGETVRALQEQSGARIKVDPNGDPSSEERTINIFGNADAVALAKQLVTDKVAEGNANRASGGYGDRGGYGGGRGGRSYGGDRYGGGGGGGGGGGDRYNDRYGGDNHGGRSRYNNNSYGSGGDYKDDSRSGGGYDYSQYQQYYGQYGGYDQNQYAASSGADDGNQSGYQYPYGGYEGYGQYPSSSATATATGSDGKDAEGEKGDTKGSDGKTTDAQDDSQQQQQWDQAAYNQWYYQQYYGGQYGDQDQQQQAYGTSTGAEDASAAPPPPPTED
ncbi:hypothetical protein BCR43DRAFT_493376 [Syncephalastrum racemosum]|uniref:K Homology domain-containing protein n=1 Tax=Syncephalastrum racemosum TaxID=13706 RepID=A0A1X2HAI5_SYNRA|nr:hypothetical protein BCR43DRAFT_493376 [Syncephalastrum racemosum]